MLTETRIGLRGRAGSVGVDGGRRRGNEHGDEVGAGVLWARLGPKRSCGKGTGGQGGLWVAGGGEKRWRARLPAAWGLCSTRSSEGRCARVAGGVLLD